MTEFLPSADGSEHRQRAIQRAFEDYQEARLSAISNDELVSLRADKADLFALTPDFIGSVEHIGASEQLAFTELFWKQLNHIQPQLNDEQKAVLDTKLQQNPDARVVPAPLLTLDGRKSITETAKFKLLDHRFAKGHTAFLEPEESSSYSLLLQNPAHLLDSQSDFRFDLGYNTASGNVVNRDDYKTSLLARGDGVEDADGLVWVFPIIQNLSTTRGLSLNNKDVGEHDGLHFLRTPESAIALLLLQQIGGKFDNIPKTELCNEAIYMTNEHGGLDDGSTLALVANVFWDSAVRQIVMTAQYGVSSERDYSPRSITNGLNP